MCLADWHVCYMGSTDRLTNQLFHIALRTASHLCAETGGRPPAEIATLLTTHAGHAELAIVATESRLASTDAIVPQTVPPGTETVATQPSLTHELESFLKKLLELLVSFPNRSLAIAAALKAVWLLQECQEVRPHILTLQPSHPCQQNPTWSSVYISLGPSQEVPAA